MNSIALLNPKGVTAIAERNLLLLSVSLLLLIIIPVLIWAFTTAWKYRAGNTKAHYAPDRAPSVFVQALWWILPALVIFVLALITWKSTFLLDPYKPIESDTAPMTIQVVALDWKWLFIYPEQHIATVNFLQIPVNTPIKFVLTADAPMNSFWIPQLGGQMYAMTGMSTQLHLMASETGDFPGSAAEVNGQGFAGMRFIARSSSQEDFDQWVTSVKQSPNTLTQDSYDILAMPSENVLANYYSNVQDNLYDAIIMKFMVGTTSPAIVHDMSSMNMEHE